MPRCCSSAIQSEVAWRAALRPFTVPASWIAPPNSSSFSVSVVLPASGCEMMANVRRRAVSACGRGHGSLQGCFVSSGDEASSLQHDGVFAPVCGLVIPAPDADLLEAESLIEPDGRQIARAAPRGMPRSRPRPLARSSRCSSSRRPKPDVAEFVQHAQVEHVRFARAQAHDAVADDLSARDRARGRCTRRAGSRGRCSRSRGTRSCAARWRRPPPGPLPSSAARVLRAPRATSSAPRGHQPVPRARFPATALACVARANFRSSHALRFSAGERSR